MKDTTDNNNYSLDELLDARSHIERQTNQQQSITQETPAKTFNTVNFYGTSKEYFSIWIVNLLLSIVTLGIYSAWATVRTNRYFYANTDIDGHRLDYLGEPMQILKGRLIGLALFGAYFAASALSPIVAMGIMAVLVVLAPLFICLSLKFKMKMTSYRHVRFSFNGRYGEAFLVFILCPLLGVFTLYLMMPWALKKIDEFIYSHMQYGSSKVETNLSTSFYFQLCFGTGLVFIILFIAASWLASPFLEAGLISDNAELNSIYALIIYALAMTVISSLYTAFIRNYVFENTTIKNVARLRSNVSFQDLTVLRFTNLIAIFASLGLALPWAKIRTAQYMAQVTQVAVLPGIESVIVNQANEASAIGEEVSDLFDFDVSLG